VYGLRRPKSIVRGTDVAGIVESVGGAVTQFHQGDEVFGWSHGSFADFAAASEMEIALKPTNLTFEQAATVPMAGLVALQAVRDHGHVTAGQKVLINGASGGIGTFAVQIAKSFGADVTGVASTRNLELVRSIGADHVIDYTREDFTENGQQYDFVLDNAGKHSLTALRRALTPTGTLIPNAGGFDRRWMASGGRLLRAMVLFRFGNQKLGRFLVTPKQADLVFLKDLIEAGKVTPVVDRTYPLTDIREAMAHVGGSPARGGHARGKVAITLAAAS
jgi:NADPH:quinone reductase-like Zn-dependent oxidoreductase